jgi:hypothetical protein
MFEGKTGEELTRSSCLKVKGGNPSQSIGTGNGFSKPNQMGWSKRAPVGGSGGPGGVGRLGKLVIGQQEVGRAS